MAGFQNLARNRDFSRLWIGQTVSDLGSQTSTFVYPLLGYALTRSAFLAGLTDAAALLGMVLAVLPAGLLADRWHRGRLMRFLSGGGALLYALLVLTVLTGVLNIAELYVVALLSGAGNGLFSPVELSALRTIVAEQDLPVALSQNEARSHLATLVGGPLGAALYGLTRWLPFLVDAASYAWSWLLLGRIRADLSRRPGPAHSRREDLGEGLRFVWRHPFYRMMLVYSPAANLVVNALFVAAVLRLVQSGTAPWQIGMVDVAAGLSGLLGAAAAPRLIARFATGHLTVAAAWTRVPLLLPMVFFNGPAVVAAGLAGVMFLNPAGNAGVGAYRLAVTPPELVGRVQASSRLVSWSTHPLAPVLGGALLSTLGGEATLATLAVLAAGVALVPTISRDIRSVPRPDRWERLATGPADVPKQAAEVGRPQ